MDFITEGWDILVKSIVFIYNTPVVEAVRIVVWHFVYSLGVFFFIVFLPIHFIITVLFNGVSHFLGKPINAIMKLGIVSLVIMMSVLLLGGDFLKSDFDILFETMKTNGEVIPLHFKVIKIASIFSYPVLVYYIIKYNSHLRTNKSLGKDFIEDWVVLPLDALVKLLYAILGSVTSNVGYTYLMDISSKAQYRHRYRRKPFIWRLYFNVINFIHYLMVAHHDDITNDKRWIEFYKVKKEDTHGIFTDPDEADKARMDGMKDLSKQLDKMKNELSEKYNLSDYSEDKPKPKQKE